MGSVEKSSTVQKRVLSCKADRSANTRWSTGVGNAATSEDTKVWIWGALNPDIGQDEAKTRRMFGREGDEGETRKSVNNSSTWPVGMDSVKSARSSEKEGDERREGGEDRRDSYMWGASRSPLYVVARDERNCEASVVERWEDATFRQEVIEGCRTVWSTKRSERKATRVVGSSCDISVSRSEVSTSKFGRPFESIIALYDRVEPSTVNRSAMEGSEPGRAEVATFKREEKKSNRSCDSSGVEAMKAERRGARMARISDGEDDSDENIWLW